MSRLGTLAIALTLSLALTKAVMAGPYDEGIRLYNQGQYQAAAKNFDQAVQASPNDSDAFYYRALNYQRLGDVNKARSAYQQIQQRFPGTRAAQYASQVLGSGSSSQGQTPANRTSAPVRVNKSSAISDADASLPPAMRPPNDLAQLPDGATIYYTPMGEWMSVDAQINGRPLKVVFDTGATVCVVGKNQLRDLNLPVPQGAPTGSGGGVGGAGQQGVWFINADIKMGTILRHNFPMEVFEHLDTPPLIGQIFVRDYDMTVDSGAHVINLTKKATRRSARESAASLGNYAVPFRMEGPKIVVVAEVNGKPYPVWLDTGNDSGLSMGRFDVQQLNINVPSQVQMSSATGVSGVTRTIIFPVDRVKLGPIEKYNFSVDVDLDSQPGGRPLLGQRFLSGWQYTVDNDLKMIKFVRR